VGASSPKRSVGFAPISVKRAPRNALNMRWSIVSVARRLAASVQRNVDGWFRWLEKLADENAGCFPEEATGIHHKNPAFYCCSSYANAEQPLKYVLKNIFPCR